MARSRQEGATRFEFAVCALVTALLAGGLLGSLLEWRAASERSAARQVIGAMRTALAARAAQLGMRGGESALFTLMQENPMDWLVRKPARYLGEYYAPDPGTLPRGAWFYDRTDRTVNYVLSSDTFSFGATKLLKFKVELNSSSPPADNRGRDGIQGVPDIAEVGTDATHNFKTAATNRITFTERIK